MNKNSISKHFSNKKSFEKKRKKIIKVIKTCLILDLNCLKKKTHQSKRKEKTFEGINDWYQKGIYYILYFMLIMYTKLGACSTKSKEHFCILHKHSDYLFSNKIKKTGFFPYNGV